MTDTVLVSGNGVAAKQSIAIGGWGALVDVGRIALGPRFSVTAMSPNVFDLSVSGWSWATAFSRHVAGVNLVIHGFTLSHHSDDLHSSFDLAMNDMLADLRQGRMPQFAPDVLDAAEAASQRRAPTSTSTPPAWVERVASATSKLDD